MNRPEPSDPVSLTEALIRCRSVTPEEGGALSLLQSVLEPMGFACHRMTFSEAGTPDVENLYARRGGQGPNLCFAGHTDVVPPGDEALWTHPPFAAEIEGGRLYGRGAVDMKGAIACFIAATARLFGRHGGDWPGSISLLITGDEEGPSINGTMKVLDWLKDRGERLDAAIVGEPSNPNTLGDEMKIGRRGSVTGDLVVHGKQGHSAYPELADNPVPKLARFIERLANTAIDDRTEHFQASTLAVTVIDVPNTATNVIPSSARARFNIRYNDRWKRPTIEAYVRGLIEQAAAEIGARYSLTFSGTGDVFLTSPGPFVTTLAEAIAAETGRKPRLTTGGGTSDARFIQAFCPVVEFGLVNRTIHQVDEHVAVEDLETLTRIYQRFLERYFAITSA